MKFRLKRFNVLLASIFMIFTTMLVGCNDEDNPAPAITGSFTATDQMLDNGMLTISSVTMSQSGWVVVHRDNGGGPMVPDIISVPKQVEAGTSTDVMVQIAEGEAISEGETLWIMLHTDDGMMGTYEFDGSNGLDGPIMDMDGNIVTSSIQVTVPASGSFMASDQDVMDNTVVLSSVTVNKTGWVVIHADNGDGPVVPEIISVPKQVEAGTTSNVEVQLLNSAGVNDGDKLWIMLHTDDGVMGEYEFDGSNGLDGPIIDDSGNVVTSPVTATTVEATGMFTAEDQMTSQNMITISSATFNKAGWIVIHKDNGSGGPMVPAIISTPKQVEAGTTTDIKVELDGSADVTNGETLWVMLHTDDGVMGTYEFDGSNGLDGPIFDDAGNVVTAPITISSASITASDQAVSSNQITIDEVVAAVDGWLVVHNDDGTGNITLPDIIGKAKVTAGVNTNVVIDLDDTETYTAGQKLFPMLHIDEAPVDEYNFPGVDAPEVFGFSADNIIVTSLTVQ